MEGALTVPQIQALDRWAIEKVGIPSLVLMENAGRAVAQAVMRQLQSPRSSVVVVCGCGNNGGDGFVAARYLSSQGVKPHLFLIGDPSSLKKDALTNFRIAQNLKIKITPLDRLSDVFKKSIRSADIIVDAIFGMGLNRDLRQPYEGIRRTGQVIVADIGIPPHKKIKSS